MAVIRMFGQQAIARVAPLQEEATISSSELVVELQDIIDGVQVVNAAEPAVLPDHDPPTSFVSTGVWSQSV